MGLMQIEVPDGVGPGQVIQVAGPSTAVPTVAGVPVGGEGGAGAAAGVAAGVAVGSYDAPHTMLMGGPEQVGYVEVDEISPAGWLCLLVGCFACPGLNLLGLCMRERRLVPVSQVQAY